MTTQTVKTNPIIKATSNYLDIWNYKAIQDAVVSMMKSSTRTSVHYMKIKLDYPAASKLRITEVLNKRVKANGRV